MATAETRVGERTIFDLPTVEENLESFQIDRKLKDLEDAHVRAIATSDKRDMSAANGRRIDLDMVLEKLAMSLDTERFDQAAYEILVERYNTIAQALKDFPPLTPAKAPKAAGPNTTVENIVESLVDDATKQTLKERSRRRREIDAQVGGVDGGGNDDDEGGNNDENTLGELEEVVNSDPPAAAQATQPVFTSAFPTAGGAAAAQAAPAAPQPPLKAGESVTTGERQPAGLTTTGGAIPKQPTPAARRRSTLVPFKNITANRRFTFDERQGTGGAGRGFVSTPHAPQTGSGGGTNFPGCSPVLENPIVDDQLDAAYGATSWRNEQLRRLEERRLSRQAGWEERESKERQEYEEVKTVLANLALKLEGTEREKKFDYDVNQTKENLEKEEVERTYRQIMNETMHDGTRAMDGYEEDDMFTTRANLHLPRFTGSTIFARHDASFKMTSASVTASKKIKPPFVQQSLPQLPQQQLSDAPRDGGEAAAASTGQPPAVLVAPPAVPAEQPPRPQPSAQATAFSGMSSTLLQFQQMMDNLAQQMQTEMIAQMQLMGESFSQAYRQRSEVHGDQIAELNRRIRENAETSHNELNAWRTAAARSSAQMPQVVDPNPMSSAVQESLAYKRLLMQRPVAEDRLGQEAKQMDFENHLRKFRDLIVKVEGATASMKLQELSHWFSGVVRQMLESYLHRDDHQEALDEALEMLQNKWGMRSTTATGMLKECISGPIVEDDDSSAHQELLLHLQQIFELAEETETSAAFDDVETMYDILQNRLPHLKDKWTKERHMEKKKFPKSDWKHVELKFSQFLSFLQFKQNLLDIDPCANRD